MKTSLLSLLFFASGLCFGGNTISFNVCNVSEGIEFKQTFEFPDQLNSFFNNNCGSPEVLTSGVALTGETNVGNAPSGGAFTAFTGIGTPNVQYYSITVPSGHDRITVDIVPTSGGPYQTWIMSNCDGVSGSQPATDITNACFPLTQGTYIIVVVSEAADAGVFEITATSFPNSIPATITAVETSGVNNNDGTICQGDDFTLEVTNNINYTYQWALGPTTLGSAFSETINNAVPSDAGLYSVTITDDNNCTLVLTQNITISPLPSPSTNILENSGNNPNDGNVCVDDDFTITASPGPVGYTYEWTTPTGTETGQIVTVTAATLADAGSYVVTVTETATGCTSAATHNVIINPLPNVNDTELEVCANAGGTGDFTLDDAELAPGFPNTNSNSGDDVDDGAGGVTVTYHSTLANAEAGTSPLPNSFTAADGTIIFARVENNATGCYETAEVTLTVNLNPTGVEIQNSDNGNSPSDFTICEQDEINLGVDEGTGGTAPYTYDWQAPSGSTFTSSTIAIASATVAAHNGTWNVTVTDANGCTGTDQINITITPNPVNDECNNAIAVATGVNGGLNNLCATEDLSACSGANNEASVWYSYDVPVGVKTLSISVSSANHSLAIFEDDCNTILSAECDQSIDLECLEAQTINIFVSSAAINAGTFSLTINETPVTAANDLCSNAEVIPATPLCEFFPVSGTTTVGACSENFTVAGCALDYSGNEIVWYEFTTPTGTASIEFDNITANAFLTVFEDCPASSILAGANCIVNNTSAPIDVTDNTTYYIAIGLNGAPGSVGFEIKYNLDVPNDECADAIDISGSTSNLTNVCATENETPCGSAQDEASVWYNYVVPAGIKTLTISTSLSGGVVQAYEGCGGPVVVDADGNDCDGSVEIDCPTAGDALKIFVSSSVLNSAIFDLTVTTVNTTAGNDLCSNSIAIPDNPECIFFPVAGSTSLGACPEGFNVAGCGLDYTADAIVWYTFTPPAGTTSVNFQNITGTLTVFEDCPATSIAPGGSCLTGANPPSVNATGGNTYWVGIGIPGGEGDVGFEIKYNVGPPNDGCPLPGGYDIGNNTVAGATNACAGADGVIGACSSGDQEATVFFEFTIPVGFNGITIDIVRTGASPISGDVIIGVISDGCGNTLFDHSCSAPYNFECLSPGTYNIMLTTSEDNAGTFDITGTLIADDGDPANDLCSTPEVITVDACVWENIQGTTVDACNETWNLSGGCDFGTSPTVFFEFTTPDGATTLDFRNIQPADGFVALFPQITDCNNPGAGFCSPAGAPLTDIPVTPNTTYTIVVGTPNPAGEPVRFDVRVVSPPANDCTPEVIASGGSATLTTTCCASNPGDVSSCTGEKESSVWYEYTPDPATKAVTVSFSPGTITGGINFEVFTGAPGQDCTGGFTPEGDPFCIVAASHEVVIKCADWTTSSIYVRVASDENNCGTFSVDFNEENGCEGPEICDEVSTILMPITDGGNECATACNNFNCSEGGDCNTDGGASVWFAFTTDAMASSAVLEADGIASPIMTVFLGTSCADMGAVVSCGTGLETIPVQPNSRYFVRVESSDPEEVGDIEFCVNIFFAAFDCYPNSNITTVTRPDYPDAPQTGPYCPGEIVNFCVHIDFIVAAAAAPDGNGCQWIQGIIPSLGYAWDYVGSDLAAQGPGGNWFWLPQNSVDYNNPSSIYSLATHPDGITFLDYGGSSAGMPGGTLLPGGWWVVSPGGSGCTNDGTPDTMWGDPFSCNGNQIYDFCIDLKVKEFVDLQDCTIDDLGFTLSVMADGETGCWSQITCALSIPVTFDGTVDCTSNILVNGDDIEICNNGTADIEVFGSEPGAVITVNTIDNPNVEGESFTNAPGVFNNSYANIIDELENTGSDVEIVQYVFYAQGENSVCKGPEFILEVTVYPELQIDFDPVYVCEGFCATITPNVSGGNGNYVGYEWSTGENTPSIEVCPTSDTEYKVTVTDDFGCTGSGVILVEWKEAVTGYMDPNPLFACKDGVDNFGDFFMIVNLETGQAPYDIRWNIPFGVFGTTDGSNHFDDTYIIEEEAAVPSPDPYELCAEVTDVWGCEVEICGELIIDGEPDVTFTHTPLVCGQNSTVLTADFDFGQSSAGLDRFELYDCDGNLIATSNNDPSLFPISDIATYNCFELHTFTFAGCVTVRTLNLTPPTGLQPIVTAQTPICEGDNSVLSVTNGPYSSIQWSTMATGTSTIVSPTSTTNYSVTVTEANGCSATRIVTVVVNPIPEITLAGSFSFCTGFNTTIEANAGPNINYQWWDNAPSVVSDTSIVTISTGGLYTVSVTGAGNCTADSTILVEESSTLQISMNAPDLCDNSVDTITPGNFFTSYNWTFNGTSLPETTGKLPITEPGNYCVTVSDGNCTGSTCVDVINNNSPIANVLIPFSEVCRINSGVGPTFIDFNTLVSGATGTWVDSDFTGVDLSNLSNVSFLDIARDTYQFTFITNTAVAPCENDTVTVDIFVRNCLCPTIAFRPIVLCNDNDDAINLNEYLIVPENIREGVWTVTAPTVIPVSNDSIISVLDVNNGVYQLAWETNASIGACNSDSTHTMTINDAPNAAINGDRFVCNAVNPLGPTNIDLDTVLVAGTSAGSWIQTSGTNVTLDANNIFDATGMAPGILQFTYNTTAATPPCTETFVVLEVNIRDCNCPIITIEDDTLCNGSDIVDLNTLLDIQPVSLPGTWTTNAPGNPITGSNFNATGITSGTYTVTYTLNSSPGIGCVDNETSNIVIRRQPTVIVVNEGSPCNANTGNGVTTVNLNSLITGTTNGVWTQISGTPSLTIPTNGVVDFNGQTIGSVFEFRYDVTAVAPCIPATATVRVEVRDCDCPNVDLLTPPVLCSSESTFDLSTLEGPNIGPGVWTVLDPVNSSVTVPANKIFNLVSTLFGNYRLTYTLDPAPSGSCPKSNQVILRVEKENTAVIPASTTVCTVNLGNGDNVIDFRTFYQGNSFGGGTWENTDNAPVVFTDITNVNFTNAVVGQFYTFTYRINNLDPCPDYAYTIEIEVIDCTCPPIRPGDPVDVCTTDGTVALSPTYNDPNNPGKWESTEVPINNNGVADVSNLPSGNYTISYVVDNPIAGCPDSEDRTLTVVKVKNAGVPAPVDVCNNEPETIRLADLLTGEETGGTWREVSTVPSLGNAFNANAGTFNTNNQAASTYTFEYAFLNQDPCPEVNSRVVVNVISAPTAQAGDPVTLNCVVATATLGDPSDNQPNVTYQWSHDGGIAVPNADKATTVVNFGGEFTIVVTDNITGCKAEDDVIITVDPNKPNARFDAKDVTCFQQRDGSITFINVTGGQAPLQYSNNGGTSFQASPVFNNLNGGTYTMVIKDATGCVFTETIVIDEPPLLSINLGNDIIITKGESDTLSLIGQLPDNLQSIQWTATDTAGVKIICNLPPEQCFEVIYKPEISTTICATVEDQNGCIAEDCKVINLIKARNVIFSNILQPENGGENKYFYVESEDIAWVNEMRVYDRWGNLMFERNNFPAGSANQALGWNGKFNGKEVVPGVYTWVVEVEYETQGSGDVEIFVGDVTVIR